MRQCSLKRQAPVISCNLKWLLLGLLEVGSRNLLFINPTPWLESGWVDWPHLRRTKDCWLDFKRSIEWVWSFSFNPIRIQFLGKIYMKWKHWPNIHQLSFFLHLGWLNLTWLACEDSNAVRFRVRGSCRRCQMWISPPNSGGHPGRKEKQRAVALTRPSAIP